MEIPEGTTHVCPSNPLDCEPKPDFFMRRYIRNNQFDEKPVYELNYWYQGRWVVDKSFCGFRGLLTVEEFKRDQKK